MSCKILQINKDTFSNLLSKYECGKDFIHLTFQKLLEDKERFEFDQITKSPEEQYQDLMEQKPDWLQLYLNIILPLI